MKILLVGNGNLRHRGARYYDQAVKLQNGLIRAGHHVYFLSDRDLTHSLDQFTTPGIPGTKAHKRKHVSRFFLDVCRHLKPEMILLAHADLIEVAALLAARELLPKVRIAQYNNDIIFNAHNAANIRAKLPAVDTTFITTAGPGLKKFAAGGKKVAFAPNLVDPSIEWPRSHEQTNQPHDVFWALRALRGFVETDRRIAWPLYLESQGVNISYHGMNGKPLLNDARYYETIAQCKMGLNISQIWTRGHYERAADEDLYLYSSDRIAHYIGSGLLTFITRDHKLEELFAEDKEAIYFDSQEELLEKIRYYAKNDSARQNIAKAGWQKMHTHFNATLVAKYIVEQTFGESFTESYSWPTEWY